MSGVKIYYSDRIEDLARELKRRLADERKAKADPFGFSKIVVPNANIARWLQIKAFADEPSLCMGVEFPFIEHALFTLLSDCLEKDRRPHLLPMNAYTNGIMSILLKDDDGSLEPFRRYIGADAGRVPVVDSRGEARMAWQLAIKLADLIDRYEVHRRNIIEKWLDGNGAAEISDPTERAEAALVRKLLGEGGIYPPSGDALSLRQLFGRVKKSCAKPYVERRKVYFFGLSTLSSLQVEIIHYLAQTHDIEIYHNNVCLEYWGDIETGSEKERSARLRAKLENLKDAEDDLDNIENPLLQNWGRAGRETLRLIVDFEEANGNSDNPIRFEWNELPPSAGRGETMLHKVQESVRRRVSDVGRVAGQDASIQIVGAPGARREVEMAYNAILGAVWKPEGSGNRPCFWSDCTFSDIALLVPDMKTYRPIIEAVFDARGQIPYGLIDSSASEYSRYLEGFMALMAVAREGLTRETVFAVLDNPCVRRAFGFTPGDVKEWRRYAKEICAFDGFDGGKNFENVSWDNALRRLRLGMVSGGGDGLAVWEGGGDSALKFSEIVETLYRELAPLSSLKLLCAAPETEESGRKNWADTLRRVSEEFLQNGRDDVMEESVRRNLFNTLYALDGIEGEQGLDFVVAAVEELIGGIKCQKGGYLTHGVTIASLQPMRPVPFKQVFVLGMGEGMFPGRDSESTLEIRGAARTLGDTGTSAINRYLFLETLMATRERLVISYPNRDIVKDAELFASGMVNELKEFLEKNVLPDTGFREVVLPLLERGEGENDVLENPVGPISWGSEYYAGLIPTYSNVERGIAWRAGNYALAAAAAGENNAAAETGEGGTAKSRGKSQARHPAATARELAEFLDAPLRTALRRQYGMALEGYRDEAIGSDPPLEIGSGPVKWNFQRAVLEVDTIEEAYKGFSGRGRLPDPDGMFGRYSLAKAKSELEARKAGFDAIKSVVGGFSADKEEKRRRIENLYGGQAADMLCSKNGRETRMLVFGRCGDERKGKNVDVSPFPPKAVLEPLAAWLMESARSDGHEDRSLRVYVVDMDQVLFNCWSWSASPAAAKEYVEGLSDSYLEYLSAPDEEGLYLDYGYSDMAKALKNASRSFEGKLPENDGEWLKAIAAFSSDGYRPKSGAFNGDLVVERTLERFRRMPDETDRDLKTVKERFEKLFRLPMDGKRCAEEEREA